MGEKRCAANENGPSRVLDRRKREMGGDGERVKGTGDERRYPRCAE